MRHFLRIVCLLTFGFLPHFVQAQDLDIQVTVPTAGDGRFSVCGGPRSVTVSITNTTPTSASSPDGIDLTALTATLDLSSLPGLTYVPGSLATTATPGGAVTYTGGGASPQFGLPDLKFGQKVDFTLQLEALCGSLPTAQAGTVNKFPVRLTYTGGNGTYQDDSPSFELVNPSLSIIRVVGNTVPGITKTGTDAQLFDATGNTTDTLAVRVVNGGNGALGQFIYWTKKHPLAQNMGVMVGTLALVKLGEDATKIYYRVPAQAIARAQARAGTPTQNTGLLQFNEILDFTETWRITGCPTGNVPDLERGVQYGCDAANELAACESTASPTGLRFDRIRPNITSRYAFDELSAAQKNAATPACYLRDGVRQYVYMVNTGNAAATNLKFSLSSYPIARNGKYLDAGSVKMSLGKPTGGASQTVLSPAKLYTQDSDHFSCPARPNEVVSADFEVNTFALQPNDTLWVEFRMDYKSCGCDRDGDLCYMDNWYQAILNWDDRNWAAPASYADACAKTYELRKVDTENYGSWLTSLAETPSLVQNNQEQTATYTATSVNNTWFYKRDRYPNGIYRMRFKVGKGLDYTGFKWKFSNGAVWPTAPSSVTTVLADGSEAIDLDFRFADFPGNADFGPGMSLELTYKGDCAETGSACMQGARPTITNTFYFSPDATCTDCGLGNLVNCTSTLPLLLKCPACGVCEGLSPKDFRLERANYERPDNNNDGFPDASGSITPSLVATQRFISGDTLRAVYTGVFSSSTGSTFAGAFSRIAMPINTGLTFLPVRGKIIISQVSTGTSYTAAVLQQSIEGTDIVTNLSPANLNTLGNVVPANLTYQNGDSVRVEVLLLAQDNTFIGRDGGNTNDVFRSIDVEDRSFATYTDTTWPVAEADRKACDFLQNRIYYIEMLQRTEWAANDVGGGCDLIAVGERQRFTIGGTDLDYFPYEYRSPKARLGTTKYYKHPTLDFVKVGWQIRSKSNYNTVFPVGTSGITLNSGNYGDLGAGPTNTNDQSDYGELPLTSPYLTINGDSITFAVDRFIRDNFPGLISDEGFTVATYLYLRGSCTTPPLEFGKTGEGRIIPTNLWLTDPAVFGYSRLLAGRVAYPPVSGIVNDGSDLRYGFRGGAELAVQVVPVSRKVAGEVACFDVKIANLTDYDANLTWLNFNSPTGAVLVDSFKEITDPNNPVSLSSTLGIYRVGNTGRSQVRTFRLCVRTNNCATDSLVITTGYDCIQYPGSLAEAKCAFKSTVFVLPEESQLGMIIRDPIAPVSTDLCGEQEYVVQLSSAKIGNLNSIILRFDIPPGQEYIPGSVSYAFPVATADLNAVTWTATTTNPTNTAGNSYQLNVSALNTELNTTGLPGVASDQNFVLVRYKTRTVCNFLSGSKVKFFATAVNACGTITNGQFSPAGTLTINGLPEVYKTRLSIRAANLNPCLGEQQVIRVSFGMMANSLPISSRDSMMVVLPPGMRYVANSLVPGANSLAIQPWLGMRNGQQTIMFDLKDGVQAGQTVAFTFRVEAFDAGQECRAYPLTAYNFSSQRATCVSSGGSCPVRSVSSESTADITFIKPDLRVTAFQAHAQGIPASSERVSYSLTVQNTGAAQAAGIATNVEIYGDVDNDGEYSPGVDVLLFTATTSAPLSPSASTTFSGTALAQSGYSCRLLAVINPKTTCTCTLTRSFRAEASFDNTFVRSVTVCANTNLTVGPQPMTGNTYAWQSLNGSNLTSLSTSASTPTVFRQDNQSGAALVQEYLLQTVRGSVCAAYDTLRVTLLPVRNATVSFNVCANVPFTLAGPTDGSNYQWTPASGISNPNAAITRHTAMSAPVTFTLTYTDATGCAATFTPTVGVVACAQTSLGDRVWYDRNYNGLQDDPATEPGVAGVQVLLFNAADLSTPINATITDSNGNYLFDQIPAGNYVVRFVPGPTMTLTSALPGADPTLNSDANPQTGFTAPQFVANGLSNLTFDAGIIYVDHGDLPTTYATLNAANGPSHIIIDGLRLGTLIDGEQNGQPATLANGDDLTTLADEDGLALTNGMSWTLGTTLTLPLTVVNTTGQTAYLKGFVDWNADGDFADSGEEVYSQSNAGNSFPAPVIGVPNTATLGPLLGVRFRLSTDPTLGASGTAAAGEVEDYVIRVVCPVLDAPTANNNPSQAICPGDVYPTFQANSGSGQTVDWYPTAMGGTPLLAGSNTYQPAAAGTYYAELRTLQTGCLSGSRTAFMLVVKTTPVILAVPLGVISCNTPTVSLTAVGEPVGGSYAWTGPDGFSSSLPNPTVSVAGTYMVMYRAANGCSVADQLDLVSDVSPPQIQSVVSGTVISCQVPSVSVQLSSDTRNTTYVWSTGETTASVSFTVGGTYSVTATAPNGCTAVNTLTIRQDSNPPALTVPAGATLTCANPRVTLTVSSTATGLTYLWSTTEATASIAVSTSGTYSVTATAPNGCSSAASVLVEKNIDVPVVTASASNTLTCTRPTATLTASSTATSLTYLWSTGETTASISVSVAGTYSVTATAPNGCFSSTTILVEQNTTAPTLTTVVSGPLTCATTSITASVTSSLAETTYLWSTGEVTASVSLTATGTYSVTATAPNGCVSTASVLVEQNNTVPVLTTSVSDTLTCARMAVTATVSSTANLTYRWSTGETTPSISVTASGTYSVTGVAANGCFAVAQARVAQDIAAPVLTPSVSGTITCANVSATLSVGARQTGYAYRWNNLEDNSPTIIVSSSGIYSVDVTAPNGCTSTAELTVEEDTTPASLTISLSHPRLTCAQTSVTATVNGLAAGGSVVWSTGATTRSVSLTATGTYSVTATAPNGCTSTESVSLSGTTQAPDAGPDQTLICKGVVPPTSATLTPGSADLTGLVWSVVSQPAGVTATVDAGGITQGMTAPGTYVFALSRADDATCRHEVTVLLPVCECPPAVCVPVGVKKTKTGNGAGN